MAMSSTLFHTSLICKPSGSPRLLPHLFRISLAPASPGSKLCLHHPDPFASRRVLQTQRISLPPSTGLITPQAVTLQMEEPEVLIAEIEAELALYGCNMGSEFLLRALNAVDLIERLGIQRYFRTQIQKIMRSVHMLWDVKSGFGDADVTVLAFRLLRLHGYAVSADVLETIRDAEQGFHAYFSTETHSQTVSMLNLYKCPQLGFPSEAKIMEEVKEFARTQLLKALSEGSTTLLETNNLKTAIIFALEFPRQCLLPRLESRSIIRQLWPAEGITRKCLELAKLDLKMLQKLYQQELHELDRWWMQHGFNEVKCARKQLAKVLFSIAANMYEPQYSAQRLAYAKTAKLAVIVDDMFDDKGSDSHKFRLFLEALKRWDPSLLEDLPEHKLVLTGLCSTVEDIAVQSSKVQNQDLLPLFKDLWIRFVGNYAVEAEWMHNEHIPSLEEYMDVAHFSIGAAILTWSSVFLTGEQITSNLCSHIGIGSHLMYLVGFITRLCNDLVGFEREAREGKVATAVSCYMRDHPECTKEEAIASISCLVESSCQELEWEIYRTADTVPECCGRAVLTCARAACLIFKRGEGFSGTVADFMEIFKDYLFYSLE